MDETRKNNFDFFRLLFATLVFVTHSYVITGNDEIDFLHHATSGKISLSYIGVRGFFIISGYLIFQSLLRSKNIIDYMWKRILRLIPGLFVMLIFTLCVVPWVYEKPKLSLLQNPSYLSYLPNNLILYKPQFVIEGIFDSNPFKSSINGSLWTIQYEFTLYLILIILFAVRNNQIYTRVILIGAFITLFFGNTIFLDSLKIYEEHLLDFGYFFFAGALLSAFSFGDVRKKKIIILVSMAIVIFSIPTAYFSVTKLLVLPVLITLLSSSSTRYINDIGVKIGDLSYGIYIYAFPIQQTIVYFTGCNTLELIISGMTITTIVSVVSWHFIEKKALSYKSIFSRLH